MESNKMRAGCIIAIDGPVASGKGTIASKLAQELNGFYLYTGAMYRSLALYAINLGIDLYNAQKIIDLLSEVHTQFRNNRVLLNGIDVTDRIKEQDTAEGASIIGVIPKVREAMVKKQQEIAANEAKKGNIVVIEGRDTGTNVFPDADLKIFLTASVAVRAKRRLVQHKQRGDTVDLEQIQDEIKQRDTRDMERKASPLASNPEKHGYIVLDNSQLNEQETIAVIKQELKKRKLL